GSAEGSIPSLHNKAQQCAQGTVHRASDTTSRADVASHILAVSCGIATKTDSFRRYNVARYNSRCEINRWQQATITGDATMVKYNFAGKVVLVTGSSRG